MQDVFITLYEQGLIYRGPRLVNWSPGLRTAVSDLEVEREEEPGKLYYFNYPLEDGGFIPVSTTRPETILGDTAVAVHPDDDRYQHLIGKFALVPVLNRRIPVIADEYVDREVRHGRAQGHAGSRLQRLRNRAAPQSAADQHHEP